MNTFAVLEQLIRGRRSTKPALLNGKKIDDSVIMALLELANWAPTHARTEPWRFIVYRGNAVAGFCSDHADLYKTNTPQDKFTIAKYENLAHMGDPVSHIIAVYMKKAENAKIPEIEEIAAVSAAVEHILLGAQALGIAVLWSTGGMTHHTSMKEHLGLQEEDRMIGLLYLGYTDEPLQEGNRSIPLEAKVSWKS